MKPPKLPGAEKFKFADKIHEKCTTAMTTATFDFQSANISVSPASFIRGLPSRSTCPISSSTLSSSPISSSINSSSGAVSLPLTVQPPIEYLNNRYETKRRRAVVPISGRIASRVLTITTSDYTMPNNHIEIRDLTNIYKIPTNSVNSNSVSLTVTSCVSVPVSTTATGNIYPPTSMTLTSGSRSSVLSDSSGSQCSSSSSSVSNLDSDQGSCHHFRYSLCEY